MLEQIHMTPGQWSYPHQECDILQNRASVILLHFLKVLPSRGEAQKSRFVYYLVSLFSFSLSNPVGKSVNPLGPIGSCGAWGLLHLLTQLWTQGSVAPFQGWPAGPKWRSTATGVTWSTQSVTTNLCPPSSPCRWDTSGRCLLFTVWFCKCFFFLNCWM